MEVRTRWKHLAGGSAQWPVLVLLAAGGVGGWARYVLSYRGRLPHNMAARRRAEILAAFAVVGASAACTLFAAGEPMYVTAIDPATARVTIGPREDLMSARLAASRANWHAEVSGTFDAIVQIRYNHRGAPARVTVTGAETFEVAFAEPVSAVTPGQAAVVYDGDRLLGGGWID